MMRSYLGGEEIYSCAHDATNQLRNLHIVKIICVAPKTTKSNHNTKKIITAHRLGEQYV